MDDATQKLVDEADAFVVEHEVFDAWRLVRKLRDALEWERDCMQSLAKWVGVDERTPSNEIACEVSAALEAGQRPPVSPGVREALLATVRAATAEYFREDLPEDGRDESDTIVDAILARFAVPVLDVERVAVLRAALDNARRRDAFTIRHGGCPHPDYTRLEDAADALIAALPTLTKEEDQ